MKEKIQKYIKLIKKFRYFILFGVLLLALNTYAWFVYVTRVDTSFSARVSSWNVMFQVHDNNIASNVVFSVGEMYPGMPDFNDHASIVNTGNTTGEAYFKIKTIQIFNDAYSDANYTNDELLDILENNYPFTISLSLTNPIVSPGNTELFNINITWPYESGDDDLDTYWGRQAYTYYNAHPNETSCITITAEIRVNQESIS